MTGPTEPASRSATAPADIRARLERLAAGMLGVSGARITRGAAEATLPAAGFALSLPLRAADGAAAGRLLGMLHLWHGAGRAALSDAERVMLDDIAAMATAALDLAEEVEAHRRDSARAALQDALLRAVAEAPSFTVAVETAMAILRDATQSKLCLFFRLAPDGVRMQLITGQADTQQLTDAYLEWVRSMPVRTDNSMVGRAASTGQQQVVAHIDQAVMDRYPAIGLSVAQRISANVVTPISLGEERYAFAVGYGETPPDLDAVASMLAGIGGALRPLLRRLRDSEEIALFRRVVEASHDPVLISAADPEALDQPVILSVNAAFTAQTGYLPAEVIGAPYAMLRVPPGEHPSDIEAAAATEAALHDAISAGRPARLDLLNRRRDGTIYWAECHMAPLPSRTGAPTHWVAIERDITERKRASDAVALSEQRLRWVARATGEAVWDWDLVTDMVWWGDGIATQFGHDAAETVRASGWWTSCLADTDRARVVDGRRRAIAEGASQWRDEYGFRCADGRLARVSDRSFLICDAEGRPVRMLGSMVDITRQQQLEDDLRQAQRLDALGRLTGGVAHDFNNLLAVIMGNAEMLAETLGEGADPPEELAMILSATERGAMLTQRLLAFARLQPLAARVTDVNRLVRDAEAVIQRLLGQDIAMLVLPAPESVFALVDPSQLENALMSVAMNAREAMPEGGGLRVEVGSAALSAAPPGSPDLTPGDYATITVTDTGPGMPPEIAARAFEPFFTTKGVGKGSGLGLSMVFGFIQQSRGHVAIGAAPGKGTSITLYLPMVPAPVRD
jgi:PAS domain S-box-containing protein